MNLITKQIKYRQTKGNKFFISSVKSWLKKMLQKCIYSLHNEGKPATERFIRTLKGKICKYMTSIPKNVYIDESDDIVNKYNNTYKTTKMKSVV